MRRWLERVVGIDQYLCSLDKRFLAHPIVASQPSIPEEATEHRDRFTLGDEPSEPLEVAGVFDLNPLYDVIAMEDRVVLYKLERTHTLALSATAGLILELMDGRRSAAQIRTLLQEAYPESAAEVGRDVDHTLAQLLENGAIERSELEALPEADGVYCLTPDFDVTTLEDRVLVHSPRRGQTHSLNPTAGIILELLDGRRSVAQLRGLLLEAYPEAAAEVARDVDRTLGTLIRCGAVRDALGRGLGRRRSGPAEAGGDGST